ncbi:hypothetical protein CO180_01840 [candidate division WWE3 bacterium CG_4_9_14_3_um_filter_41_6]|uniref:Heat-inducible transcription repressor HrcA n=1 Tax=candidate division WWE3 bacterium CG_4_10_14_0_2_um_filter_41_14 TaxID=1975072 RepID=A0A2M7TKQ9_UNCKA|nr:MAG: hypothetical protein COY32_02565 [candidate division WWE3 bacterium CG_4_10_14_0_2_um_filter_41_14]PJA38976.1 MAG: hypothetical protein CO180_01840 [candidate division WWE3 bacterium CG_4_9_14_3_um_filter_41_6]
METEISKRQQDILQAIIKEYIETAEPVGSEFVVSKYNFDFSPATTRNEMVELTNKGFLAKDHISAGRIPTPLAFRYYVKNLMDEKQIPVVNEVAIKQRLWEYRHDMNHMLKQATYAVADELHNLTFLITDDGDVYVAGAAHILRHPEFYDIDLTRTVLHLLDRYDMLHAMADQLAGDSELGLLLGEETGLPNMNGCGIVISRLHLPQGQGGFLSVFGPYRLDYQSVIPTIRYMQGLINELSRSW